MKEIRAKDNKELKKMLDESRREFAGLKTSRALGSLGDGAQIKSKRVEIARIMTVLKEKEVIDGANVKEEGVNK